jgi:hypothetical protein
MKRGEIYHFVVEGAGLFPIDMLRYDACWPHTEGDSHIIERSREDYSKVQVTLSAVYNGGTHHPCAERWKSFTWKVVACDGRRFA